MQSSKSRNKILKSHSISTNPLSDRGEQEHTEEFLAKKISKYDVLKVRVFLEDHFFIFSRFLVSRILTLNKIPPKDSIRIAMDLKKLLVEEEKFEVKQSEMENELIIMGIALSADIRW
jgi:hypothetical protein